MRRISRNLLSAISRKQSAKQLASRRNCAPPEDSSSSAQSYTQTDCALLTRLPFDVRLLIYDCIYSVEIHYSALGEDSYIIANASEYHTSSPASSPPIRPELKYRHLWTLLLTCKAIYSEAYHYLYTRPLYVLHQPRSIPQQWRTNLARLCFRFELFRFPQITTNTQYDMSMPQYKSFCQMLASMSNLSELKIILRQEYFFVGQRGTPEINTLLVGVLEPFKQISVKGQNASFKVYINWNLGQEVARALGECPFQIVEVDGKKDVRDIIA